MLQILKNIKASHIVLIFEYQIPPDLKQAIKDDPNKEKFIGFDIKLSKWDLIKLLFGISFNNLINKNF